MTSIKKRISRRLAALAAAALFLALLPVTALAAGTDGPCFAVLVGSAPEDLSLSLRYPAEAGHDPVVLEKDVRAWETYYRFDYHGAPVNWKYGMPKGTELLAETGAESFSCLLPEKEQGGQNTLFVLDLKARTLREGAPWYRHGLLTALRVVITLLLQGTIFFLFRYRSRRSALVYACFCAVVQLLLNGCLLWGTSTLFCTDMVWDLVLLSMTEFFIFIIGTAAVALLMREHSERRAIACGLAANFAALGVSVLSLCLLPL